MSKISRQCRDISLLDVTYCSAGASLNEPLPPTELQQLALNFLATFLVVTLLNQNNPSYRFQRLLGMHVSSAWAIYVALSSLILPLRQPIQPFTTNKAFQLYTAIGPFFSRVPPPLRVVCAGSA